MLPGPRLLRLLFEARWRALAGQFELGLAFIATDNAVALQVPTQVLGLPVVGEVVAEGRAYAILISPILDVNS
jgi:hypothetical protein